MGLRDGRKIIVPIAEDYSDFCQKVFIVYHEYICEDNYVSTINEDEHWYCRNCGKEFSHEMNFRKDVYGRIVCPYCESRKLDKVHGAFDSFYD